VTLESLLHEGAHPHVIDRMRKRFGNLVIQAVSERNNELAKDTYEKACALPQTMTEQEILVAGYSLNGSMLGNDNLIICYRGTITHLLKVLTPKEKERGSMYLEGVAGSSNRYVTEFELYQFKEKHFMIMPMYTSVLETVPAPLVKESCMKLWHELSLGLSFIQSVGFVHMDVKPTNICLRENGDSILIDLGSVVRVGVKSQCTHVYFPRDMRNTDWQDNTYVADISIDWWMLSVVIADKMFDLEIGSPRNTPSRQELIDKFIVAGYVEIAAVMLSHLPKK
jgi:serine/threonine protein kinase